MKKFWFGLGLALTIMVGALLPARTVVPSGALSGPPAMGLAQGPKGLPNLQEPACGTSSKASLKPHRQGSSLQKGQTADGDGAPPREHLDALPALLARFRSIRPANASAGFAHPHPRTFSPHGMQPEQGGQTGPPTDFVTC